MNLVARWGVRTSAFGIILQAVLTCGCGNTSTFLPTSQEETLFAQVAAPVDYEIVAAAFSDTDNKWLLSARPRGGGGTGQMRFEWDFGNGTVASGSEQVFAPTSSGVYTIRVRGYESTGAALFTLTLRLEVPELSLLAGVPVAEAGNDLTVVPGDNVVLNASLSSDPDGDSLSYAWTQIAGTPVSMTGAASSLASFFAPDVAAPDRLVFVLTVSDGVYESEDFVGIDVMGTGPNIIEAATCTFTVGDEDSVETLDGRRPMNIVSRATILKGPISDDATLTWVVDGGSLSGPVAELETMSNVFNTAGVHVLALALTSAGVTVSCVSTRSNSLSEQVKVWPKITGRATDPDGLGVLGATVIAGPNGPTAVTGPDGTYFVEVPHGWSGTVQVHRDGYEFTPPEQSFSNLIRDTTGDFFALEAASGCASNADCDDQVTCTLDVCDTASGTCDHTANNSACDNGVFCDGAETCNPASGCVSGSNPCAAVEVCDETGNRCVSAPECTTNADCDDGLYCNGAESCAASACAPGTAPCTTGELCNEATNTCETGTMVYGTVSLVDTVGARPSIGQLGLTLTGSGDWSGTAYTYLALTDSQGNYQQAVPNGWTGTVSATDPGRVAIMSPKPVWLFGAGGDAPAVTSATRLDFTAWTAPIGIPMPDFGITESHWMYQGQRYDFDGDGQLELGEEYRDAGSGPYTHYVDNTITGATDTNNPLGTPARPRLTIPTALSPGSVVELHGGPYNYSNGPGGEVLLAGAGTPSQPVFIRGTSRLSRPEFTKQGLIGYYRSPTYLVVENAKFPKVILAAPSASFTSDLHHVALRACEIQGNATSGGISVASWSANASHHLLLWNNVIHDNGDWQADFDQDVHAIGVTARCNTIWIVDNEMYHNSGDGLQINAGNLLNMPTTHHIYAGRNHSHENKQTGMWTKQAVDVVFSQNLVHSLRPIGTNPSAWGSGMGFQYGPERVWFLYNHVYDCCFGIQTASTSGLGNGQDAYLVGNLIHDIHHDPSYSYTPGSSWSNAGIMLVGTVNKYIVNNTIFDVDAGINSPSSDPLYLYNNIISNVTDPLGKHVYLEMAGAQASSVMENCLLWQNGSPVRISWGHGVQDLIQFQSTTGKGANCVKADPLFTSPATGDFRLLPASPAIDAGTAPDVYDVFESLYGISIRVDHDGAPSPAGGGYDVGAFED